MTTIHDLRPADDPRATRVALRRELVGEGWTDHALRARVRAGELVRVRTGAYVDAAAWSRLDDDGRHEVRARAVVRQASSKLVVSHTSGLVLHDAPTWGADLSSVHVTRRDRRAGRAEAGVTQHRGLLLPGDVVRRGEVWVTHPTRLALECTTLVGVEAALVQVGDLLHRGLTTLDDLRNRYEQSMTHWPRSLTTDLVLRLVDPRWESVGERRACYLFWKHGLPMPIPQYEVRDESGVVVARLDFAWPQFGVFGEFDGKVKYTRLLKPGESVTDVVLREKRREELVCRLTGWRCARFIWGDLERGAQTAWDLSKVLAAGTAA